MPDTTGRIRAKALDQTGITETLLEKDWAGGAGRTRLAVVELRSVEPHGPNLDGKKRIDYVIESIEPVPAAQEDAVREFQRALYRQRPEVEGQAVLSGTDEGGPTLDQATAQLSSHVEHREDGSVGIWDGSTDGPLTPDEHDGEPPVAPPTGTDDVASKRKTRAKKEQCDYPTCDLPAEHEGDHRDPGIE